MGYRNEQGYFQLLKNKIRQTWMNLSEDDIARYERSRERFLDLVQKKYGIAREQLDRLLCGLERQCRKAS